MSFSSYSRTVQTCHVSSVIQNAGVTINLFDKNTFGVVVRATATTTVGSTIVPLSETPTLPCLL